MKNKRFSIVISDCEANCIFSYIFLYKRHIELRIYPLASVHMVIRCSKARHEFLFFAHFLSRIEFKFYIFFFYVPYLIAIIFSYLFIYFFFWITQVCYQSVLFPPPLYLFSFHVNKGYPDDTLYIDHLKTTDVLFLFLPFYIQCKPFFLLLKYIFLIISSNNDFFLVRCSVCFKSTS